MTVEKLTPSKGLNKIALDFLAEYLKDLNSNIDINPFVEKYGNFTG